MVVAAGAITSSFPLFAPSIFTVTIAGFCLSSSSVPLSISRGAVTDEDDERKPASVAMKIEGTERGKEEGTAPAATTTAPEQLACHAGGACCDCGLQSSCKTTRCTCRWVGRNCVSCWYLVQCANVVPQT